MVVRAKPERSEERERVRRALFDATLRLAAEHGFASLSLREVSREAQIAPTSFYRYFEDMEELGLALIVEHVGPRWRALCERTGGATTQPNGAARAIVESVFAAVAAEPQPFRFLMAERVGGFPRFRAAIGALVAELRQAVEGVLRKAGDPARQHPSLRNAADALVVIALDAGLRFLEPANEGRSELASRTIEQIQMVILGLAQLDDGHPEARETRGTA